MPNRSLLSWVAGGPNSASTRQVHKESRRPAFSRLNDPNESARWAAGGAWADRPVVRRRVATRSVGSRWHQAKRVVGPKTVLVPALEVE